MKILFGRILVLAAAVVAGITVGMIDIGAQAPDVSKILASIKAADKGQLAVSEGEHVQAGQKLLVLEFMKTELTITASSAGSVARVLCREGAPVAPGQALLVINSSG